MTSSSDNLQNIASPGSGSNSKSMAILNSSGFPTKGVLDAFNRNDPTIGKNWSIDRSGFKLANNQLSVKSGGMIFWKPTSFGSDQEAYVTFVNVDTAASNMDLLLKSQTSSGKKSFLEVSYNPVKNIIKILSYTSAKGYVQCGTDIPVTFTNGDQLGARATSDGKITVFKNGISLSTCDVISWPDYARGGYLGLLAWGAPNATFDDFGGGSMVVSAEQNPSATANLPTQTGVNTPMATITRTTGPTATATNTFTPTQTGMNTPMATVTRTTGPTTTVINTFTLTPTNTPSARTVPFSFVSMGDAQAEAANFTRTVNQIAALRPDLLIFNGDLENDGVVSSEINPMTTALKNVNLYNQTFLVRGNHDDHVSGSAALWESYFEAAPNTRILPAGVTDYVSLNSNSDYLSYSFVYGNSMFIGLDIPGDVSLITSTQLSFLDSRLTIAEGKGLVHAFIYFHGPLYCVESTHCTCSTKADGSCTPTALVSVINRHPIVSATFHGHEHVLGWVHMDNTRVAGLTGSFEEFITSPSGGWTYNSYLYPARMDYTYMNMGTSQGFTTVTVNGNSFTFSIYKVGTTLPVWSKTFTKDGALAINTPTVVTPAVTNTPVAVVKPQKYYMADRVINNGDFAQLAGWGINTAVVDFDVNGNATTWRAVFTEAAKYNINIVIWPSDWNNPRPNCDWEAPYPVSVNGDITKVKPLLDVASQYSNFIGIINGHESFWTCTNMTFDEMAGLKNQLKAYALARGRTIKIWNYINGLYDSSKFPDNQISRIMDVAIIWKHCAGIAEGPCDFGNYSALAQLLSDRARLTTAGLDGKVDLVYIIQTFTTSGGYAIKFTLPQLEYYSCEFLNTSALDGFGFYTWDAGWWPDLHSWTDLQPAIPYVHDTCLHTVP
jgi:3',5'-cyclic AMP phosphodiesterase CpdA